jgi:hypothetical protein
VAFGYGSGLAYGFKKEVVAPLAGGLAGGAQIVWTNLSDASGALGPAWVPTVWPTNGEMINTLSGTGAIVAAAAGAAGKGRYLSTHDGARKAVAAYGIVTLVGGWLIPALIRFVQGGSFLGRGRRGTGRYAFLPSPAPSAQQAEVYGSGITSQANQQVLRRLFASPY